MRSLDFLNATQEYQWGDGARDMPDVPKHFCNRSTRRCPIRAHGTRDPRIAMSEEGYIVPGSHQSLREEVDNALDPTVVLRRHRDPWVGGKGYAHEAW